MGSSKYCLLVTATILFVGLVNQSASASAIGENISSKITPTATAAANENVDIQPAAVVGEDENIVTAMAEKAMELIHKSAQDYTTEGPVGEAIKVFRNGWEKTLKLVAFALARAFNLVDRILTSDIKDKIAALNAINNGMNDVRSLIYRSGGPVHSCLGFGKSLANITDSGAFKVAIDRIQETGTGLFDDIDSAQFFTIQGLNSDDDVVKQKCLQASHSALKSAAETANTNFINGAIGAFKYLHNSDIETITAPNSREHLISDEAKKAAAADSDTVEALAELNEEFDSALKIGISAPILKEIKSGLEEYIDHASLSVAISYEVLEQAKPLANTDPKEAIRLIENAFPIAKAILIDGSIKAYESLGSAGKLIGAVEFFQDAIEMAERSRVEGTKGYDAAKTVATRGILTGGAAKDHALDASHKMVQANEAVIFDQIDKVRHIIFKLLHTGSVPEHVHH